MLKKQENQIARTLKASCDKHGLNFGDFLFKPDDKLVADYTIKYEDSKYFFGVSEGGAGFDVRFRPGSDNEHFRTNVARLEDANKWIEEWVDALVNEKNTPDLWEEFSRSQTTNVSEATDNESLTQEEQNKALQAIEDVKARILELESGNEEAKEELKAHIDSHFSHLEEAVSRVGKKDYILMFQATVFNVITGWMLSPESRSAIWLFAMEQVRIQLIPDMVIPGLPN